MSVKFKKLMAKMKEKLGFSLIEMLVVIAIIAVLVSIIIPVVNKSVQKSAAATNAANLRAIEGQVSVMRVENPQIFSDSLEQFGQTISDFLTTSTLSQDAQGYVILNLLAYYSDSSNPDIDTDAIDFARYYVYHDTATAEGVLTISVDPPVTVNDVPASKAVNVPGMELPEGVPMTLYVSDKAILATYEAGGNSYTKEDFAYVAEHGTFEGRDASGGLTSEELSQKMECASGNHTPMDDQCKCKFCGAVAHTFVDGYCTKCGRGEYSHNCNICGAVYFDNVALGGNDANCPNFSDGNHTCAQEGCNNVKATDDGYCSSHAYAHTCDICSAVYRDGSAIETVTACPNLTTIDHTCAQSGCGNYKASKSDYCSSHAHAHTCDMCGTVYRDGNFIENTSNCPNAKNHTACPCQEEINFFGKCSKLTGGCGHDTHTPGACTG